MTRLHRSSAGFTLIEMIMVIVITGIIAGVVAVFITKPVQGYVDSVRRAELTDAADVALRRITRDVRLSLPNSLRIDTSTSTNYIELIMTSAGGRYRDPADGSTGGDFLSFTVSTDFTFDVLGPAPTTISPDDFLVIYNLGEGYAPANAYVTADPCAACNRAKVKAVTGNNVELYTNPFADQSPPLPSPSSRFQVVPGSVKAVTFACQNTAPGGLIRYWNYGFNASAPITAPGGSSATLAANATCAVEYTANATGRNGLLYISLTLTDSSGEAVTLFQQIHVDNSP